MKRRSRRSAFTTEMASDGKRLVRGEHWLLARTLLRRRDEVHHKAWTVLTTAGEHPEDELRCIRELMPKAQITAVDKSPSAVEAPTRAGADMALECDLYDFRKPVPQHDNVSRLPECIASLVPFDVINLDLCCDAASAVPLIRRYSYAVAKKGTLILTFSYGRDVAELHDRGDFGCVPAPLGGRVRTVAEVAPARLGHMTSVLAYTGNQMPMCSCVWGQGKKHETVTAYMQGFSSHEEKRLFPPESFQRIGDADLYAAVAMFDRVDPEMLYALPAERVLHFRQKLAAEKAVATRRARQAAKEAATKDGTATATE